MRIEQLAVLALQGKPGVISLSAAELGDPAQIGNFLDVIMNHVRAAGLIQLLVTEVYEPAPGHQSSGKDPFEDRKPAVMARHLREWLQPFALPDERFLCDEPIRVTGQTFCFKVKRSPKSDSK